MNVTLKTDVKTGEFLIKTLRKELRKQLAHIAWEGKSGHTPDPVVAGLMRRMRIEAHIQRHRLLAYGYLRGLTYRQIESKTWEGNPPNMKMVLDLVGDPKEADFLRFWIQIGTVPRDNVRASTDQAIEVERLMKEAHRANRELTTTKRDLDNARTRVANLASNLECSKRDLLAHEARFAAVEERVQVANAAFAQSKALLDQGVAA